MKKDIHPTYRQVVFRDRAAGYAFRTGSTLTSGELISSLFGGLVGAGQAVANVIFSIVISVVLTLYFLTSLPAIKEVIYQLAPASRRART